MAFLLLSYNWIFKMHLHICDTVGHQIELSLSKSSYGIAPDGINVCYVVHSYTDEQTCVQTLTLMDTM